MDDESESEDTPGPSGSPGNKSPKISGTNKRTFFAEITRDSDLFHDFILVMDSIRTGTPYTRDQLKTADRVGYYTTRSNKNQDPDLPETLNMYEKTRSSNKPLFDKPANLLKFNEAELPSDDEEDEEFQPQSEEADDDEEEEEEHETISSNKASDEEETESVTLSQQDENSRFSEKSVNSTIAKKTRSKIRLPDNFDDILNGTQFFDDEPVPQPSTSYLGVHDDTTEYDSEYMQFLNETFQTKPEELKNMNHDDERDADYNPVPEMFQSKKTRDEEEGNEKQGIYRISKKECRDLQDDNLNDLFEQFTPKINLEEDQRRRNKSESCDAPVGEAGNSENVPTEEFFFYQEVEEYGMTPQQHEMLQTQLHQHIQLLGQSMLLMRSDESLAEKLQSKHGFLSQADYNLCEIIEMTHPNKVPNLQQVYNHAFPMRDHVWKAEDHKFISKKRRDDERERWITPLCAKKMLECYLFPFIEILPRINKIYTQQNIKSTTLGMNIWGRNLAMSPGEENMFVFYWNYYISYSEIKSCAVFVEWLRKHTIFKHFTDSFLKKLYKTIRKRNPMKIPLEMRNTTSSNAVVELFRDTGELPRKSVTIKPIAYENFKSARWLIKQLIVPEDDINYPEELLQIIEDSEKIKRQTVYQKPRFVQQNVVMRAPQTRFEIPWRQHAAQNRSFCPVLPPPVLQPYSFPPTAPPPTFPSAQPPIPYQPEVIDLVSPNTPVVYPYSQNTAIELSPVDDPVPLPDPDPVPAQEFLPDPSPVVESAPPVASEPPTPTPPKFKGDVLLTPEQLRRAIKKVSPTKIVNETPITQSQDEPLDLSMKTAVKVAQSAPLDFSKTMPAQEHTQQQNKKPRKRAQITTLATKPFSPLPEAGQREKLLSDGTPAKKILFPKSPAKSSLKDSSSSKNKQRSVKIGSVTEHLLEELDPPSFSPAKNLMDAIEKSGIPTFTVDGPKPPKKSCLRQETTPDVPIRQMVPSKILAPTPVKKLDAPVRPENAPKTRSIITQNVEEKDKNQTSEVKPQKCFSRCPAVQCDLKHISPCPSRERIVCTNQPATNPTGQARRHRQQKLPKKRIPLTTISLANDKPPKTKIPAGSTLIQPNHRPFDAKESTILMNKIRQRKLSAEINRAPVSPELEGDKLIQLAKERIRQNSMAQIQKRVSQGNITSNDQSQPCIQPLLRAERQLPEDELRSVHSMIEATNRNQRYFPNPSNYSKPKDVVVTSKPTVKQYWNPLKSKHETEAMEEEDSSYVPPPRFKEKSAVNKKKKVNHDERFKDQSHQFHENLVAEENLAAAWGSAIGKKRRKSAEKPIQEKKQEPLKITPVKQPDVASCRTKSLPVEEPTSDTCESSEEISQDSLSPERLKRSTSSVVRTAKKRKLAAPKWSPIKAKKTAPEELVVPAQNQPAQMTQNPIAPPVVHQFHHQARECRIAKLLKETVINNIQADVALIKSPSIKYEGRKSFMNLPHNKILDQLSKLSPDIRAIFDSLPRDGGKEKFCEALRKLILPGRRSMIPEILKNTDAKNDLDQDLMDTSTTTIIPAHSIFKDTSPTPNVMRLNENSTSNEAEPDTTIVPKPVMPDIVLSSANEDSMSSNPDPSVFVQKGKRIILKDNDDEINKDNVNQLSKEKTRSIDLDETESQWETESEEDIAPSAATNTEEDNDDDWETESEEEVFVPQTSNAKPEQTKVVDLKQTKNQKDSNNFQKTLPVEDHPKASLPIAESKTDHPKTNLVSKEFVPEKIEAAVVAKVSSFPDENQADASRDTSSVAAAAETSEEPEEIPISSTDESSEDDSDSEEDTYINEAGDEFPEYDHPFLKPPYLSFDLPFEFSEHMRLLPQEKLLLDTEDLYDFLFWRILFSMHDWPPELFQEQNRIYWAELLSVNMVKMNAWIDKQLDLLELYPKKTAAMRNLIKMNRAIKGKGPFIDDPSKHRESTYWKIYFSPQYKEIKEKKLKKKLHSLSREEFKAVQMKNKERIKKLEMEKKNASESAKAKTSQKTPETAPRSPQKKKAKAPPEVTKTQSLVKNKKPTPRKRPQPNLLKATVIKEAKRRSGDKGQPEKKKSANMEESSEARSVKPK